MINLIYGAKGSGKTKKIIDAANACAADAKGDVVYITDNDKSLEIGSTIRFINVNDYDIHCKGCLVGFLKGMIAANSDNTKFYIDGVGRILDKKPDEDGGAVQEARGDLRPVRRGFHPDDLGGRGSQIHEEVSLTAGARSGTCITFPHETKARG